MAVRTGFISECHIDIWHWQNYTMENNLTAAANSVHQAHIQTFMNFEHSEMTSGRIRCKISHRTLYFFPLYSWLYFRFFYHPLLERVRMAHKMCVCVSHHSVTIFHLKYYEMLITMVTIVFLTNKVREWDPLKQSNQPMRDRACNGDKIVAENYSRPD